MNMLQKLAYNRARRARFWCAREPVSMPVTEITHGVGQYDYTPEGDNYGRFISIGQYQCDSLVNRS